MEKIIKPVLNGYITSDYFEKRPTQSGIHGGYDIGSKKHPCYVRAICDCEVYTAGWSDSFGFRVWVRPTDKELREKYPYIVYAHLEKISTNLPRTLQAGQIIGIMGNTGKSNGVHLHIEARTSIPDPSSHVNIVELPELYGYNNLKV
jgi:murein DD-endopeptidase MepM/ murein hydrolase activator NlpD